MVDQGFDVRMDGIEERTVRRDRLPGCAPTIQRARRQFDDSACDVPVCPIYQVAIRRTARHGGVRPHADEP